MHNKKPFTSFVSLGLIVAGMSSWATACYIAASTDCCTLAGVVLNTTRKCGLFNDQDCPDKATTNTGNVPYTTTAVTGKMQSTPGQSFVCAYQLGGCTGSIGGNLCAYDPVVTTSCTSSTPSGDDCPTGSGGGES